MYVHLQEVFSNFILILKYKRSWVFCSHKQRTFTRVYCMLQARISDGWPWYLYEEYFVNLKQNWCKLNSHIQWLSQYSYLGFKYSHLNIYKNPPSVNSTLKAPKHDPAKASWLELFYIPLSIHDIHFISPLAHLLQGVLPSCSCIWYRRLYLPSAKVFIFRLYLIHHKYLFMCYSVRVPNLFLYVYDTQLMQLLRIFNHLSIGASSGCYLKMVTEVKTPLQEVY